MMMTITTSNDDGKRVSSNCMQPQHVTTCLPTNKQAFAAATTTIAVVATITIIGAFWLSLEHSKVLLSHCFVCYLSWNHSCLLSLFVKFWCLPFFTFEQSKATQWLNRWGQLFERHSFQEPAQQFLVDVMTWIHFEPAALPPGSSGFQQPAAICWVLIDFGQVLIVPLGRVQQLQQQNVKLFWKKKQYSTSNKCDGNHNSSGIGNIGNDDGCRNNSNFGKGAIAVSGDKQPQYWTYFSVENHQSTTSDNCCSNNSGLGNGLTCNWQL